MKTVLVIDDKQIVREAIQDWLEEEGFHTFGAASGKVGIQQAIQYLPDLILCDVLMPDVSGYEVLKHLRQNPVTATIPFIFLTVKSSKEDIRYGMELGADDYLTKPCTAKELINAVTSRLEKQAQLQSQSQQQLEILRSSLALSLPHEFRTPLTGIMTGIELLRLTANSPQEILEIADSIEECTDRLYNLVKKFLLYAELEITIRDPSRLQALQKYEAWEPSSMLQETLARIAKQREREADLQLCLQQASVSISEAHLVRLIEEIVDNAFKFSEPGTPVQISSEVGEVGTEAQYYAISILNYGQGLSPEQIAAIGAYMQFDRRYYEQQGSGLGLSIARRITELYGGRLLINSIPGQETIVKVLLPVVKSLL